MRCRTVLMMAVFALCSLATHAQRKFDFIIKPDPSRLDVNVILRALTDGTLVGNWDPSSNPGGTRTKPGVAFTFGPTENVPVPCEVNPTIEGQVQSKPTGVFALVLHPESGQAVMLDYFSNLLPYGSVRLPASAEFYTPNGFRTRQPSSTYPPGRFTVPVGDVVVTHLTITQTAAPATGTLTPLGSNSYTFIVTPIVVLYIRAEMGEYVLETTSNPSPLLLTGEVQVSGETATVFSNNAIDWSDEDTLNEPIPRFAMDMPTVLPPGDIAHLLFDLVLREVRTHLNGIFVFSADGVLSYRNVSGQIVLGDYGGDKSGMPVPIEVRGSDTGEPLEIHVVALDSAGEYRFRSALWGTFALSAKASHWLRQSVNNVSLTSDVRVDFYLTNGDIDGDNEVTLFDFGRLVASFGSMPGDSNWNPNADLDGDEEVTLFDFGILVKNFGAIGDE